MRIAFVLLSFFWLSGCGTVTTLANSDQQISSKLLKRNTYCHSVTRVYSGVAYDLCTLHSKPSGIEIDWVLGFYMFDGALSAVADTLVLPYTIFQQSTEGSLQVAL